MKPVYPFVSCRIGGFEYQFDPDGGNVWKLNYARLQWELLSSIEAMQVRQQLVEREATDLLFSPRQLKRLRFHRWLASVGRNGEMDEEMAILELDEPLSADDPCAECGAPMWQHDDGECPMAPAEEDV